MTIGKPKPRSARGPRNREEDDMRQLAAYLDALPTIGPLGWCHVPNETRATPWYLAKRRALGVKAGVPDVLIFRPPPVTVTWTPCKGVAIEIKRAHGPVRVSNEQHAWLDELDKDGWVTGICRGFEAARTFLRGLGYENVDCHTA